MISIAHAVSRIPPNAKKVKGPRSDTFRHQARGGYSCSLYRMSIILGAAPGSGSRAFRQILGEGPHVKSRQDCSRTGIRLANLPSVLTSLMCHEPGSPVYVYSVYSRVGGSCGTSRSSDLPRPSYRGSMPRRRRWPTRCRRPVFVCVRLVMGVIYRLVRFFFGIIGLIGLQPRSPQLAIISPTQ